MHITLPNTLLLGGSFNPLHIMHIRMIIEAAEMLQPQQALFIPAASPPHKPTSNLLPFDVRVELLEKSLAPFNNFFVSTLEAKRDGPSYTIDTLIALQQQAPYTRFGFVMGSEDILQLPTWSRWQQLPQYTDLILLHRGTVDLALAKKTVQEFWGITEEYTLLLPCTKDEHGQVQCYAPNERYVLQPEQETGAVFILPCGGRVFFMPQPRVDVSSSLVRERWCAGRSIIGLVPTAVLEYLMANKKATLALWQR